MLELQLGGIEYFDESTNQFIIMESKIFRFEHSLHTISQWEAKHKKPYLSPHYEKTPEEALDYTFIMCQDKGLDLKMLNNNAISEISEYMNDPQTATTINRQSSETSSRILTSEVIYGYMANAHIPFECDRWHLNRLMTLLEVMSSFSEKPKKMSPDEIREQNKRLNEERRRQLNTKG